jgi:hypothetical protein
MGEIEINEYCKSIIAQSKIISKNSGLNHTAALAILFWAATGTHQIEIKDEDFLSIIQRGYIKNGKISKEGLALFDDKSSKIKSKNINSSLPILTLETGNIVKRLSIHFFGDMFKGSDYKQYNEKCDNAIMAPFFFMFMNMFPTSNASKNKHWDKHFSTWTNVNLRRITDMTVKNFKKVYKTKDIGLFLLGTYMFIKESHNQEKNQYFVKSLENYWREYDYWYGTAEAMLLNGELDTFTKPAKKVDTNNIIMI